VSLLLDREGSDGYVDCMDHHLRADRRTGRTVDSAGGVLADITVGILGALIGGWLYRLFGHVGPAAYQFSLPSFVCALIGAVVLLWLIRLIRGRPAAV
jgi:uncharacterized membrane protein YeaQ/YmgE (transglycosylase-associated protein family)